MQILGDRLLVSRIEDEKKEGFQVVEIQNSFLYKGRIEQSNDSDFLIGSTVYFAKYSPHTQELDVKGEVMKVIRVEDVIAIENV